METTILNRNTAFKEIQDKLPKRRKYIYELIQAIGIVSPQEICEKYSFKSNEISPRFTELRNSGYIKIVGSRLSKRSNKYNAVYRITTEEERIEIINKKYQELIDQKNKLINDLNLGLSELTKSTVKKHIYKIDNIISSL
jgi:DNA-binding Lrp family transcriptional regulator